MSGRTGRPVTDRPDRVALVALLMALLLLLVAAASGKAASLGERTLKVGKSGADVRAVQIRLKRLSFFSRRVDGRFGRATKVAVVRYQRSRCLRADGIVGRATATALLARRRACRRGPRGGRRPARKKVSRRYFTNDLGARTVQRGMRGRDVRTLQRLLALGPSGAFDASTARAVRRFQRDAGLKGDGRVGPATRAALARRRMRAANSTWYGPGFYGNRTACGQTMSTTLRGVAHRTLPCGTPVVLSFRGRFLTVPVVDRGPYTAGFVLDLTASAARVLGFGGSGSVRALY